MTPFGEHLDPRDAAARPAQPSAPPTSSPAAAPDAAHVPGIWWEILAVLCIAAVPLFVSGIGPRWKEDFGRDSTRVEAEAFRAAASLWTVIPVLWIARRGGMSWQELGFVRPDRAGWAILFVTTLLTAGVHRLTWWLWCVLYPSGAKKLWSESLSGVVDETGDEPVHATADEAVGVAAFEPVPDPTALDHGMTVVAEVLNGIAEETAMRAYLLMRLRAATGSWAVAIFGSSAIFAAYHSHYDAFGISCVFVFGLLFTASWLATKNLWVVALAHALCNLWLEYA